MFRAFEQRFDGLNKIYQCGPARVMGGGKGGFGGGVCACFDHGVFLSIAVSELPPIWAGLRPLTNESCQTFSLVYLN